MKDKTCLGRKSGAGFFRSEVPRAERHDKECRARRRIMPRNPAPFRNVRLGSPDLLHKPADLQPELVAHFDDLALSNRPIADA